MNKNRSVPVLDYLWIQSTTSSHNDSRPWRLVELTGRRFSKECVFVSDLVSIQMSGFDFFFSHTEMAKAKSTLSWYRAMSSEPKIYQQKAGWDLSPVDWSRDFCGHLLIIAAVIWNIYHKGYWAKFNLWKHFKATSREHRVASHHLLQQSAMAAVWMRAWFPVFHRPKQNALVPRVSHYTWSEDYMSIPRAGKRTKTRCREQMEQLAEQNLMKSNKLIPF